MRRPAALFATLLLGGCATTLSTMDTARTTPVKHVRANAAVGLYLPAGPLYDLVTTGVDAAKAARSGEQILDAAQAEKVYVAAVAVALMPPAPVQEAMIRTGILDDLDLGLRLATTSLRLDAKYRFFHRGDDLGVSHHASVGLGGSRYLFSSPVFQALDLVEISDFSRWDLEIPLLYSLEARDILALYVGAKYVLTSFSLDGNLYGMQNLLASTMILPALTDRIDSRMHFFGGVLGLGAGYRYVFLFAEIGAGYLHARPRFYGFVENRVKEHDVGGVTLYPSVGLVVRI